MAPWWSVSWKRVGKTLLIIFLTPLILAGAGLLVQYQLAPWRIARNFAVSFPDLDRVPIAPPDKSVATLDGERIERFGFSIQLPWKDVYLDRTWKDFALISSHDGPAMTMYNPSAQLDRSSAMRFLANQFPALHYGTNYALMAAAMDAKPVQVKWWKTSKQNATDLRLLLIKSEIEVDCKGPLYSLQFGEIRGFQHGNPSQAPYCAKLDLFDRSDRRYEFRIDGHPEPAPVVTQAQINAMVASLRPINRQ